MLLHVYFINVAGSIIIILINIISMNMKMDQLKCDLLFIVDYFTFVIIFKYFKILCRCFMFLLYYPKNNKYSDLLQYHSLFYYFLRYLLTSLLDLISFYYIIIS